MRSDPKIEQLHHLYCKTTGFDLPLRMGRDRAWFDFDKAGFTGEDLLLVINWIRRQIGVARSGYTRSSLRFSKLLELDYFEERLQLALMDERAKQRKPSLVQQTQQVGDISRAIEVPADDPGPVTAGDVALKILRDCRESLKQNR